MVTETKDEFMIIRKLLCYAPSNIKKDFIELVTYLKIVSYNLTINIQFIYHITITFVVQDSMDSAPNCLRVTSTLSELVFKMFRCSAPDYRVQSVMQQTV